MQGVSSTTAPVNADRRLLSRNFDPLPEPTFPGSVSCAFFPVVPAEGNANGVPSISPGLAALGLPWVIVA